MSTPQAFNQPGSPLLAGTGGADRTRLWSLVGLGAQVVFLVGWLVAQLWQGPAYSAVAHTISDMYALAAPHATVLIVCITLGGLGTILFAVLGVRPALRGAGWPATVGWVLLTFSILGLGDLLTPWEREGCRLADPGCTPALQNANLGGQLDSALSTIGLFAFVAAGFFLAAAMNRLPAWRPLVRSTRWVTILVAVLLVATAASESFGLGGLFERLLAAAASLGVAALALTVLQREPPPQPR